MRLTERALVIGAVGCLAILIGSCTAKPVNTNTNTNTNSHPSPQPSGTTAPEGFDIDSAKQAPERKLESKTQIETGTVRYSSFMEAKLTGQGFDIKPITPERQPVSSTQETRWSWDVKAVSSGDQDLHLVLNAIFEGTGAEKTRTVTTFNKPIRVKVSWASSVGSFASNNWQWLITVIFIPALAWAGPRLWKLVRKEKK
jgi:hypothetical protein